MSKGDENYRLWNDVEILRNRVITSIPENAAYPLGRNTSLGEGKIS